MGNAIITNKIADNLLTQRVEIRKSDHSDPRGYFFRDATAIMHSAAFRRLKHKTQVFFAPSHDHICTRLEHVLHVASIAVTICKSLHLNTDMAWAIGLGHDLGHAPFGHLGEKILSNLTGKNFHHELHSLRVVDKLSKLNLTYAVRDGIVTHCGEIFEQIIHPTHLVQDITQYTDRRHYSSTFEGTIVRMADKIAYLGRDYEDAITLGLLKKDALPLPLTHTLGSESNSDIINSFATDIINYAQKHGTIGFSDQVYDALLVFKDYNYKNIYESSLLKEQGKRFQKLLEIVYEYLFSACDTHTDDIDAYQYSEYVLVQKFHEHVCHYNTLYDMSDEESRIYAIIDYIAGMTDDYVINTVKNSLFPNIEISKL